MSKENKVKDDITNMEVTRMWYKDLHGYRYNVVKYADPYGYTDRQAEEVPIYVGMDGETPRLLGEVLQELKRYQEREVLTKKENDTRIDNLSNRVGYLEESESLRNRKKKWWKR